MLVMLCIALLVLLIKVPSLLDEKDKNILYVDYDKSKDEPSQESEELVENKNENDKASKEADEILNDIYNK
ncbi:hypothetical protein [uncultured Clostridium sp.]|uniref:hypothetical protein n=1 Tax=uncultured Clostridium sp. TaxID=59620 RepID=UPI0026F3984D|nr:hypothetical protein [uncultured Clostridium sp.]